MMPFALWLSLFVRGMNNRESTQFLDTYTVPFHGDCIGGAGELHAAFSKKSRMNFANAMTDTVKY
jgi:hypothetical protein